MTADDAATGARKRRNRLLAVGGFAIILALSVYPAALVLAQPLLAIASDTSRADMILVLGGDGPRRAYRAAELYRAKVAPRILVSGDGDCLSIRDSLVELGVGGGDIAVECRSRNTWENARFSAEILRQDEVQSVVVVSSWFHMRRAMACLETAAPEVKWKSGPFEPEFSLPRLAVDIDGFGILKEYFKLAWYAVRYGVWPWNTPASGGTG